MKHKHTNSLINETSPYLLQHAHNPVDWYPWNEESLKKAKDEDKLLLISIGYSACHWCHVMERESFEDEEVAQIMNNNFICIKIDREERPDIDQIYMTAIHLMNNRGGWPLNCIALPDGRPFWGGTYFRKQDWKDKILQMAGFYTTDKQRVFEFAEKLSQGIQQVENIVENKKEITFSNSHLEKIIPKWSERWDNKEGGSLGSPKFPMPNSYEFLLLYSHLHKNREVENHVKTTLNKMASGGIYDQIGGGFARYSVDEFWKVPHFEKMLYDNGQLVSMYSKAFLKYKQDLYKEVVFETIDFVERELMNEDGAFYSALDADSEGEEGKFYVWSKQELQQILKEDYPVFKDYYTINQNGLWEGNYILLRRQTKESICEKHMISSSEINKKIQRWKDLLRKKRENRERPGLDDKSLTSWNSLMLKGCVESYLCFGEEKHLNIALKNAEFIVEKQMNKDGRLWHSYKNGRSTINGFLEDYALTISAFIRLFEATCDEKWINYSEKLMEYSISHFYNKLNGMFFFTSDLDPKLVVRKMEINDNVIPASNSVIANALFDLGSILGKEKYKQMSLKIVNNVKSEMENYPSGYSNYATLMLKQVHPYYEIAVVGKDAKKKVLELHKKYNPNTLFIGSFGKSDLDLLKDKYVEGKTMVYVCKDKVCQLPTTNVNEALKLIK